MNTPGFTQTILSSLQERCAHDGTRPEEGHKSALRDGAPPLQGQAERTGSVQPKEKAPERPESGFSVSKGGL